MAAPLTCLAILVSWIVLLALDVRSGADYDVWLGRGRELPPLVRGAGVLAPAIAAGEWWRLFTAGFVHAGVFHLLANAFGLLFVSMAVARRYGVARFLAIYAAATMAGNLLAFLSWYGTERVTVGASGAVLGTTGALLLLAGRFRSQASNATLAIAVITGSLAYGLFYANVSNEADLGGLLGGLAMARLLGPPREWAAWTTEQEERELRESLAAEAELRRRLVLPPEPFAPEHVLVLPLRGRAVWRSRILAALLLLLLAPIAIAVGSSGVFTGQAEVSLRAVLVVALVALFCGGGGIALLLHCMGGDLTLTPRGFTVRSVRTRWHVPWTDVAYFYPRDIHGARFVSYAFTPAAQARREPTGWQRLFWDGTGTSQADYGELTHAQLVDLLNEWRRRWTTPPPAPTPPKRRGRPVVARLLGWLRRGRSPNYGP